MGSSAEEDMLTERRRLHEKLKSDICLVRDQKPYEIHNEAVHDENRIYNVVYYGLALIHPTVATSSEDIEELLKCEADVYWLVVNLHGYIAKNAPSMADAYRSKRHEEERVMSLKPLSAVGKLAINMATDHPGLYHEPEPRFADRACAVAFLLMQGLRLAKLHKIDAKDLERYIDLIDVANAPDKFPSEIIAEAEGKKRKRRSVCSWEC
jgi:hypothetical protein